MTIFESEAWRVGCHSDQPVTGAVTIVHSQVDLHKFKKGNILVANQTDVNYTPYMLDAVAVITVEGGRYSHAATFSRENSIPCLIGVAGILEKLNDGDIITVDTRTKTIVLLTNE